MASRYSPCRGLSLTPESLQSCRKPSLRPSLTPENVKNRLPHLKSYQFLHQKRSFFFTPKPGFKPIYEIALLRRKTEEMNQSSALIPPKSLSPLKRIAEKCNFKSSEPSYTPSTRSVKVQTSSLHPGFRLPNRRQGRNSEEQALKESIKELNQRLALIRRRGG